MYVCFLLFNLTARTSEPLEILAVADLLVQWHWFKKATSDTGRSEEQELNGVTKAVSFSML